MKLYVDPNVKPVAAQQRSIPYHLKDRANKAIQEIVQQDLMEKHRQD